MYSIVTNILVVLHNLLQCVCICICMYICIYMYIYIYIYIYIIYYIKDLKKKNVKIQNGFSSFQTLLSGVPQGSVL